MTTRDQLRAEALQRGFPEPEVEHAMALARPCAKHREGGIVAGHFGEPIMAPPGREDRWFPLAATIDCAAVPSHATDIPLPADGLLLFFGYPEEHGEGEVVYVPPGDTLEEYQVHPDTSTEPYFDEVYEDYQRGDITLVPTLSLPFAGETEAMAEVCADLSGGLDRVFLLGGYGTDCNGDVPADLAAYAAARHADEPQHAHDWVLLAELAVDHPASGGATMYWTIRRDDLAAHRFDRAQFLVDYNP